MLNIFGKKKKSGPSSDDSKKENKMLIGILSSIGKKAIQALEVAGYHDFWGISTSDIKSILDAKDEAVTKKILLKIAHRVISWLHYEAMPMMHKNAVDSGHRVACMIHPEFSGHAPDLIVTVVKMKLHTNELDFEGSMKYTLGNVGQIVEAIDKNVDIDFKDYLPPFMKKEPQPEIGESEFGISEPQSDNPVLDAIMGDEMSEDDLPDYDQEPEEHQ